MAAIIRGGGRLLELRARVPDQSGPFRGFDRNEGGEVLRGPDLRLRANLAKFALISGDRRASLTAALSLLTIDAGVPAGASTPVQDADGNPLYPFSSIVGTSGNAGRRCGLITAKGLTLPD